MRAHPRIVSSDYFADDGDSACPRPRLYRSRRRRLAGTWSIINEAAVRRYWPDADPIGDRISLGAPVRWREIVGVVGDIRHEGLDAEANPEAYMPYRQAFTALGTGLVRGR